MKIYINVDKILIKLGRIRTHLLLSVFCLYQNLNKFVLTVQVYMADLCNSRNDYLRSRILYTIGNKKQTGFV
jgi:hypothetical protein